MSCCTPRLCGCSIKINDTSVKAPIVVEPDPPSVEMCVTHFFNPATEQWVEQLVPCSELLGMCVTHFFNPATEQWVEQLVPCSELLEVRLE